MKKHITPNRRGQLLSILFIFLAIGSYAAAQAGEIKGKVLDEKGEGLIGASVVLIDAKGVQTGKGTAADIDGNYTLSPLAPGSYNLKVSSVGYQSKMVNGVNVAADKPTILNFQLKPSAKQIGDVAVIAYKKPLLEKADTKIEQSISVSNVQSYGLTGSDWVSTPAKRSKRKESVSVSVNQISGNAAGVTQAAPAYFYSDQATYNWSAPTAAKMSIKGGRADEAQYIVNGHRVMGTEEYDMDMVPFPVPVPDDMRDTTTAETYKKIVDNKFLSPVAAPLSTFSIDVDVASYGITRRKINEGYLPQRDAVRIEEMVNYFPYDYAGPSDDKPFAVHTEFAECPWDATHRLLRIGIQGKKIAEENLPASNLVFLVDVSGSMMSPERLPLIQKSLDMLVDRMRPQDHIALVAYAGNAGLVLPSTSGANKDLIKGAINNLTAGGSTAGGAGIELAYKVAVDNFIKDGNNRVMLCTDGDFNVGISSEADLTKLIEQKRKTGVFLSLLGVGTDNYKDREMEALADKGNGNYAYIDNEKEAKKNLVTQMGGTLHVIAKDVKIQTVFNPGCVKSYRLIGYENRMLENKDFSNDKIDAGEIGAGTAVTALYEIVLGPDRKESTVALEDGKGKDDMQLTADDVMALRIRYKAPDGDKSKLIESHVSVNAKELSATSDDFRFAAAVSGFGMLLRNSPFKGDLTFDKAKALANGSLGADKEGYRHELIKLIDQAHSISTRTASK